MSDIGMVLLLANSTLLLEPSQVVAEVSKNEVLRKRTSNGLSAPSNNKNYQENSGETLRQKEKEEKEKKEKKEEKEKKEKKERKEKKAKKEKKKEKKNRK